MKKMIKSTQSGVTLISLAITIIVLIILATIGVSTGIDTINSAKLTRFNADMKIMQMKVNEWYDDWKNGEVEVLSQGESILDPSTEQGRQAQEVVFKSEASGIDWQELSIEEKSDYRYYSNEELKTLGVEAVEQEFFINIKERMVISYAGLKYKGEIYYTINQLPQIDIYNVGAESQTGQPTFSIKTSVIEQNARWKIQVYDVTYTEGYINKWYVQYRLQGEEKWKISKNLIFEVTKARHI